MSLSPQALNLIKSNMTVSSSLQIPMSAAPLVIEITNWVAEQEKLTKGDKEPHNIEQ